MYVYKQINNRNYLNNSHLRKYTLRVKVGTRKLQKKKEINKMIDDCYLQPNEY